MLVYLLKRGRGKKTQVTSLGERENPPKEFLYCTLFFLVNPLTQGDIICKVVVCLVGKGYGSNLF